MTFEEYVNGRSIAVVGPAPMPVDQSAEIDAHDLVYRPAHSINSEPRTGRIDIAYLNGQAGRQIYDDDHDPVRKQIDPATWWVYKGSTSMVGRLEGNWRRCIRPALNVNLNAITAIIFDLLQHPTGPISVYGADLYAAGPGNAYYPGYDKRDVTGQAQGIIMHEPMKQMRVHRAAYSTGRVVGDDRYLAAVTMTDEEYQAVIDRWKAVLEEANA